MEDPQQATLMELCNRGIGVYSPHTSIDGAVGGMNDWLAEVATGGLGAAIEPIIPVSVEGRTLAREADRRTREWRIRTSVYIVGENGHRPRLQTSKNWSRLGIPYPQHVTIANSSASCSITNWKWVSGYTNDRSLCRIRIQRL
jgi:putative NIF3 family GTP cyclohydrolase 1 type 2